MYSLHFYFLKKTDYELVRIYHPDCSNARDLPPTTSHARFQAISNAYAVLSGKKLASGSTSLDHNDVPYHEEVQRRKRAQWRAAAGSDEFGHSGPSMWELQEREKLDQAALIFIIVLVICNVFQFTNICFLTVFFQALTVSVLPLSLLSPFVAGRQRHQEAAKHLADARREAKDVSEIRRLAMLHRQHNFNNSNREKVEPEGDEPLRENISKL